VVATIVVLYKVEAEKLTELSSMFAQRASAMPSPSTQNGQNIGVNFRRFHKFLLGFAPQLNVDLVVDFLNRKKIFESISTLI